MLQSRHTAVSHGLSTRTVVILVVLLISCTLISGIKTASTRDLGWNRLSEHSFINKTKFLTPGCRMACAPPMRLSSRFMVGRACFLTRLRGQFLATSTMVTWATRISSCTHAGNRGCNWTYIGAKHQIQDSFTIGNLTISSSNPNEHQIQDSFTIRNLTMSSSNPNALIG